MIGVIHKRRGLAILTTLIALMAILFLVKSCIALPSDTYLMTRFKANRSCFARITALALEDAKKGIGRITPDRVQLVITVVPPQESERRRLLPDARWNEYRHLFTCAGLDHINGGIAFGPNSVMFLAATRGLAGSGDEKGYLWTREVPEPLVTSLDGLRSSNHAGVGQWFERIDTEWYLEFAQE